MPYSEVGVVSNASKEIVVGLQADQQQVQLKIYATAVFESAEVKVETVNGDEIYSSKENLSPLKAFISSFEIPGKTTLKDLVIAVYHNGRKLIDVKYEEAGEQEIPAAAQAAKRPAEVENNEQLFLTGQHLEQYRHATYKAADYYGEALRRDPKDIRCNNAMGLLKLRQGHFEEAEAYFRKAITTSTQRNPNPYDGEPYYNLGWSLQMQAKYDLAFDAFYKATWNHAWQHAGFLNLARIACRRNDFEEALQLIEQSIVRNYHSHTARHLKAVALRKLGRMNEAVSFIDESLKLDPFNFGCIFEKMQMMATSSAADAMSRELLTLSRNWVHNILEYALDYAHAGLGDEAIRLLQLHIKYAEEKYPMTFYCLGWLFQLKGDEVRAAECYSAAGNLNADHCFPNRMEEVVILKAAMAFNGNDAKAPYYLGNLWYDKRQYEDAINCWERSATIDEDFPTVHRNLSLAYYNKQHDENKAHASLTKAFELDTTDARVLMELDQLRKRLDHDHAARLAFLEKYSLLVESRDDLFLELITLHNQLGHFEKAKELLAGRKFHPWEGGEGKVVNQYLICYIALARKAIQSGNYSAAIGLLDQAAEYPDNLGEGKLPGASENDIHYLKGMALQRMGDDTQADRMFRLATEGNSEPAQAIFYNDPQPDKILYQGLAWIELEEKEKAYSIFQKLISFGKAHMDDKISIDYFAVSLPELLVFDIDLDLRNKIHCLYLIALGELGLAMMEEPAAGDVFQNVLALDKNHQGALLHKDLKHQLAGAMKDSA
ncbi:MAG: tetratricopeptide repeat protein [Chitinophagaceae bacterium]